MCERANDPPTHTHRETSPVTLKSMGSTLAEFLTVPSSLPVYPMSVNDVITSALNVTSNHKHDTVTSTSGQCGKIRGLELCQA